MDNLNVEQKYAASFDGQHLLVLAGAGTGKTRTIIARAKHLINSGVMSDRILILSFTRKSANEIVERIHSELDSSQSMGLRGATFHSWCMSIIKSNPKIFPQADYTILDEDDSESCFKLICGKKWQAKGIGEKVIKPAMIKEVYSYMINAQCSLSKAIRMLMYDNAPDELDVSKDAEILKGVISMYIKYKNERKYIDYDDILLVVSKYLKKDKEIREYIASQYDHILIDEMQDTNPLQYELISSFYEKCHLFCVGDDAQSIYGFRGADFNSIHHFAEIVPNAEVCRLNINYRSTQGILDLSNWLINQSPLNYNKNLTAIRGDGDKPVIKHWADEWEEANDIAKSIKSSMIAQGKRWADILVLSRSAWGLKKVEACFLKNNIPYTVFGGSAIMQSRHIRDLVAPMRVINNYLDEIAWSRYLQLWRNVGPVMSSKIIGQMLNCSDISECLEELNKIVGIKKLQAELVTALRELSKYQHNPKEAIENTLPIMESQFIETYGEEWDWRRKDFNILQDLASEMGSIGEFITEYIIDPKLDITKKDKGKKDDVVILSTIHSAKGLEADNVYLVNASVFSYPTPKAILNGEDAIEEERRCLYVALTRAKDELNIYRNIHSIHISNHQEERYFLNKIPDDLYITNVITKRQFPTETMKNQGVEIDIYSDIDLD